MKNYLPFSPRVFDLGEHDKSLIEAAFTEHEAMTNEEKIELAGILDNPRALEYYNWLDEKFGRYIIKANFCSMAMKNAVAAKSYIGMVEEAIKEGGISKDRQIAHIGLTDEELGEDDYLKPKNG